MKTEVNNKGTIDEAIDIGSLESSDRDKLLQLLLNMFTEAENEKEEIKADRDVRVKELETECKLLELKQERAYKRCSSIVYCITVLSIIIILILGSMHFVSLNRTFDTLRDLEFVVEVDNEAEANSGSDIVSSFNTVNGDNSGFNVQEGTENSIEISDEDNGIEEAVTDED